MPRNGLRRRKAWKELNQNRSKKEPMQIAYWLIPAEPFLSIARETIARLAAELDAPVFEPHVTMFAARCSSDDIVREADDLLQRAIGVLKTADKFTPITLLPTDIHSSPIFTKTLFIEFAPHDSLSQWTEALRMASGNRSDYQLQPHLSLLYKHLSEIERQRIIRELSPPLDPVLFDRVQAVCVPDQIESPEDVKGWNVIASVALD